MPATKTRLRNTPPLAIDELPLLNEKQAGNIRRIANLAAQLPDDWSGMQGRSTLQEDFGAYRFQLAYMFYALALAHAHRLPAAPGVFRKTMQQLIKKIMSPDCWTYWHYVSTGGGPFNQSLGQMPSEWNPVKKDNIMYSAYLQSMALMYHYLFDDARYAEPGALTLRHTPLFWGNGPKEFVYDQNTLNEQIYWNMVETGYLGVACEPNCIFQICSQPPILGFRFHDMIYGGTTAKEVTDGYRKAWAEFGKGYLNDSGHYHMLIQNKERNLITPDECGWSDFWCAALMSSWNSEFTRSQYRRHAEKWFKQGPDDTVWVPSPAPLTPRGDEPLATCFAFGWATVCASEMGDTENLNKMLKYADTYFSPTWDKGAYYHRRNDIWYDDNGNFTAVDPCSGNALISYGRLNVDGGLQKLYDGVWDKSHFAEPALDEISGDVEILRAWYDKASDGLVLTIAPRENVSAKTKLHLANVWNRGDWSITVDGQETTSGNDTAVGKSGPLQARREETSLVLELTLDKPVTLVMGWSK